MILSILSPVAALAFPPTNQWQQAAGPGSVGINVLYRNGAEVLAGTNGEGVFRSSDNGATWQAANGGLEGIAVQALAANGSFLFAGVAPDDFGHGGVYRSSDDGASWTPANAGIEGSLILCLFTDGPRLYAGDISNGVYESTDNGTTWTLSNNGMGVQSVRGMAKSGAALFAIGDNFTFRSTDNGANWSHVPPLDFFSFFSIVADGSTIYAGGWDNVSRSTDGGNTWTNVSIDFPNLTRVASLSFDGNRVYAGTDATPAAGVYRSTDNGLTWAPSNAGIEIVSVSAVLAIPGHVLAGSQQKSLLASSDNGVTWARSTTGLAPGGNIRKLVADTSGMIAATGGNGIFRSSDEGSTWTEIDEADGGMLKNEIVLSVAVTPGALFAGTASSGVFRSTNDGAHWTQADTGIPANDRTIPAVVAAGANVVVGTGQSGIFYSSDGGAHWNASNAPAASVPGLASSGTGFTYALVAVGIGLTDGVYRSSDSGRTWTQVFPSGSNTFASIAAEGSSVYVGDLLNGMFRSTDNGLSWTDISPAPGIGVFSILSRGTDLYAGSQGNSQELYKSTDRGNTWVSFNDGLQFNTPVEALAADAASVIWAGTDQRAVWGRSLANPAGVPGVALVDGDLGMAATNPFRLSSVISFRIPSAAQVRLGVYDPAGRLVAALVEQRLDAGTYSRRFDAGALPAGVYFARLQADGRAVARRLVRLP